MATISFTGNLGGDVELRFTNSGKAVANFSVADTLNRRNPQTNEWEEVSTTWWRVQAWDRLAETLAEHLRTGTRVVVEGTVHAREYETREGEKRTSYDVVARTVGIIPKSGSGAAATTGGGQRPPARGGDAWSTPVGSSFSDEPPF